MMRGGRAPRDRPDKNRMTMSRLVSALAAARSEVKHSQSNANAKTGFSPRRSASHPSKGAPITAPTKTAGKSQDKRYGLILYGAVENTADRALPMDISIRSAPRPAAQAIAAMR